MTRLGALLFLVVSASCGDARYAYDRNDLELLTSYSAKETCSCLFVMEQDEAFCRTWTRQNPPLDRVDIDYERKRVRSSALTVWGATAEWVNEREGCVLK